MPWRLETLNVASTTEVIWNTCQGVCMSICLSVLSVYLSVCLVCLDRFCLPADKTKATAKDDCALM